MEYKLGITLSGGGARGIAHLGVLKALNEDEIYPDVISGTSMGAVMGAFYADGYAPDEVMEIFKKEKITGYFKYHLPNKGMIKTDKLFSALQNYLSVKNFEDLKIPLYVTTTNFENGRQCIFSSGNIVKVLQATTAAPVIFDPIEIDGVLHVDGGLVSNMPIEPIKDKCERLLGVSVNPIIEEDQFDSIFSNVERVMIIGLWQNIKMHIPECDLFIEPQELGNYSVKDISKKQEMFEIGYRFTKELLQKNKNKL